jgi:hypothetical protein
VANDAFAQISGFIPTDLNGDRFVDATDIVIVDTNTENYVVKRTP